MGFQFYFWNNFIPNVDSNINENERNIDEILT